MRLIDADALCRNLTDWQYGEFARAGHEVEYNLINKVLGGISAAPAIDAVPVVRCRDCIYCESGVNEDESWEYCYWFGSEIDGNEFCSYGERKDGDMNG